MKSGIPEAAREGQSQGEAIAIVGIQTWKEMEEVDHNGVLRQLIQPAIKVSGLEGEDQELGIGMAVHKGREDGERQRLRIIRMGG
jgi:hypothetical protein